MALAFYIKKTFVDTQSGIGLVNIHYTWTPNRNERWESYWGYVSIHSKEDETDAKGKGRTRHLPISPLRHLPFFPSYADRSRV